MSEWRMWLEAWVVWTLAILIVMGIGRLSGRGERWRWGMGITLFLLAIIGVQALLWRVLG